MSEFLKSEHKNSLNVLFYYFEKLLIYPARKWICKSRVIVLSHIQN